MLHNLNKIVRFVGKTAVLYRLIKEKHVKLLYFAVKSKYGKVANKMKDKINNEGKRTLKYKEVVKRLQINDDSNCFITMKDHKKNFENKPSLRLINPAKNQIERISKAILHKIKSQLNFNQ